MEGPLISVILPVYNVQTYLPRCMNSLFKQTYHNLEFVMIDDGSELACAEACDEYLKMDNRVVVYHKENGGLSDARNYGIARARGKYITCVDPDDYVDIDYIEYLYMLIRKYPCKMSICQHRVWYNNGNVKDFGKPGDECLSNKQCLERMLYHDVIDTSACGKLYRVELFETVQYPKGKLFEDIGTTYALMLQCDDIAVGYESKYNYIFHNNSIVNSLFSIKKMDMLEMTDKMATGVLKCYPELYKAVRRRQVYARLSTLNQMIYEKGYIKQRNEIIAYVKKYGNEVMRDAKAPKRDKVALRLLSINFQLYRICWIIYRNYIMGGKKYDT